MHITIRQSGGFAGQGVDLASLDTERSAPAVEADLERVLGDIGFQGLVEAGGTGPVGADLPTYEVTVSRADTSETVVFTTEEEGPPEAVRTLLDMIARAG
jgi:hypothetical protein